MILLPYSPFSSPWEAATSALRSPLYSSPCQMCIRDRQHPAGVQLLVLTRVQFGPLQLPDLIVQRIHPAGALRLVHLEGGDPPPQLVPAAIGHPVLLQKRLMPAKPVQVAQVAGGIQ